MSGLTLVLLCCDLQESCELKREFTHAAHKGVVKSLDAAGPFLASGGADDLIHLYDLKHNKDLGFLMNPGEGAITALSFFTPKNSFYPTHLLAGCTDGTLSIWIAGQGWQCMKTLRGHRQEVSSIAIHNTGLLALTTSRDKTLRLWDLVKGRTTFQSKLEHEAEQIAFSPSGTRYGIRCGSTVTIFPVSGGDMNPCMTLDHSRKVSSFCFGNVDDAILTGTEDGTIRAWSTSEDRPPRVVVQLEKAHTSRIKDFAVPKSYTVKGKSSEGIPEVEALALGGDFPAFLATASSDGRISIWKLLEAIESVSKRSPIQNAGDFLLSSVDTKARLTTLCAMDSVEMMELLVMEKSSVARAVKNTAKKHKKKVTPDAPKARNPSRVPDRDKQEPIPKNKKEASPEVRTIVHGADTVVSFIDAKDREREVKKKKRLEINAKRMSGATKRKRGA